MDDLRTVTVDMKRIKGRQIVVQREVSVMLLPGSLWSYKDSRPAIFGLDVNRYVTSRQSQEYPGRFGKNEGQGSNHTLRKDHFVDQEIRWLGVPLSCSGLARDGDIDVRQGISEVIITTDCSYTWEYVFQIDNQTGLPKSMTKCAPQKIVPRLGKASPACQERTIYLEWIDGPWKMPKKIRLEIFFPTGFVKWVKSEYEVTSWINPDLDVKFFDIELKPEMSPDIWMKYLRSKQ